MESKSGVAVMRGVLLTVIRDAIRGCKIRTWFSCQSNRRSKAPSQVLLAPCV